MPKEAQFHVRHQRQLLFATKAANLGLVTVYQFLLIYVLTRTVGADVYPYVVFLASMGNYILSTDLGFSGYVYAHVRERFVRGDSGSSHDFVNAAINFYFVLPTLSFAIAAVVVPTALDWSPALMLGLVLYFASIVYSLPWQMVRNIMLATDAFLLMETLEFFRRLAFLLLAAAMLAGLSFPAFAALCVLTWFIAFAIALSVIVRQGTPLRVLGPRQVASFVAANRGKVARTGTFGGLEFILYNFPYLLIPALSLGANALVFFDLFYKVCRFGGVSYNVPLETVLPYQTRAWHEGRIEEVSRLQRQAIYMCIPIFLCAAIILQFWGSQFFDFLLHDFPPVPSVLIHAMIAMLLMILFQATAGRFLVGIGRYAELVKLALVSVLLSGAMALIAYFFALTFGEFMALYVAVYAAYAALYQFVFHSEVRSALAGSRE